MARAKRTEQDLKQVFKEALVETLHEQREFLHEVFVEVLEDFALARAIHEGRKTPFATREEVFQIFPGPPGRSPSALPPI